MKQKHPSISLALILVVVVPILAFTGAVTAQNSYSITQVDHQVQVMYSGHIAVLDTIHVSGSVTDGFQIGLPYQFSTYVLKGFAYDSTHQYQLNLGVPIGVDGNQNALYGAEVNFDGQSPSVFTVAFILSNSLMVDQSTGDFLISFPAYPSLTTSVANCKVNLLFPSSPVSLSISKDDGNTTSATYSRSNLAAYTYSVGSANFQIAPGTMQLADINSLNRQINIDAAGKVAVSDRYQVTSQATGFFASFIISLPVEAQNIAITDARGTGLGYYLSNSATGNMQLANVTFTTFLSKGQAATLIAQYKMPSSIPQGADFALSNFQIFPSLSYYVDLATAVFNPPQGATIVSPQSSALPKTSTLSRSVYQDTLNINQNGLSYVDYLAPQPSNLQFAYNYNPLWVSFTPTFWAAAIAVIGCVGAVIYRRQRPREESYAQKAERISEHETHHAHPAGEAKAYETKVGQTISKDDIEAFLEIYENRRELVNELHSMDVKAAKGKIPRRQYKVQRQQIETRIDSLDRNIERIKAKFRSSQVVYSDLAKQLDLAEQDFAEAEENIRDLQKRQARGEMSLESYKQSISEFEKQREKAESAINGILLRLREKTH